MFAKRFTGQKTIVLMLSPETTVGATGYLSNFNCPIGMAIKQLKGVKSLSVGCPNVYINDIDYKIVGDAGDCRFVKLTTESKLSVPFILRKVS